MTDDHCRNTSESVDAILNDRVPNAQHRLLKNGRMMVSLEGNAVFRPFFVNQNAHRPGSILPPPRTRAVAANRSAPAVLPAKPRPRLTHSSRFEVLGESQLPVSRDSSRDSSRERVRDSTRDAFGGVLQGEPKPLWVRRGEADPDSLAFLTGSLPKIIQGGRR
jgi:hypothetical protein